MPFRVECDFQILCSDILKFNVLDFHIFNNVVPGTMGMIKNEPWVPDQVNFNYLTDFVEMVVQGFL